MYSLAYVQDSLYNTLQSTERDMKLEIITSAVLQTTNCPLYWVWCYSTFIDTPSSSCLPESPVSVTCATLEGSHPFLCPSYMYGIMHHDVLGINTNALGW